MVLEKTHNAEWLRVLYRDLGGANNRCQLANHVQNQETLHPMALRERYKSKDWMVHVSWKTIFTIFTWLLLWGVKSMWKWWHIKRQPVWLIFLPVVARQKPSLNTDRKTEPDNTCCEFWFRLWNLREALLGDPFVSKVNSSGVPFVPLNPPYLSIPWSNKPRQKAEVKINSPPSRNVINSLKERKTRLRRQKVGGGLFLKEGPTGQ